MTKHLNTARRLLIERGLSDIEIHRWESLMDRVHFAQDHFTDNRGRPWTARDYQRDSWNSQALRKVHCDGRDVGKTTEIEMIAAWAAVAMPNAQVLVAAQTENHLHPLMDRIVRRYTQCPKLSPSLAEVKRTPSWQVRFTNGFCLWGRIAGPRGVNFQGMHVDWQIIDEAQAMTEAAWGEIYQALNGGGRRWVYGVPNGLRNTFYRLSQNPDAEQYNWPSSLNPSFDAAKDAELAQLYGGRKSAGYIHRVLGQHGAPAHAVFDLDDYNACVDEAIDFQDIAIDGDESLIIASPPRGQYYLGCDLGYARDPSEFVIYKNDPPHLINVMRVHLEGVNYARQQEIICALDEAFDFMAVAIDAGNSGRAVAHQLLASGQPWTHKLLTIEFGGMIDLGTYENGEPHRRRAKEFMTECIVRRMAGRSLVLPPLPDRESQYAAHTYAVSESGQTRYEKANDHIIDADRCALLAHYLDTHDPGNPPPMPPRVVGF